MLTSTDWHPRTWLVDFLSSDARPPLNHWSFNHVQNSSRESLKISNSRFPFVIAMRRMTNMTN